MTRETSPVALLGTLTDRLRSANLLVGDALIAIAFASIAVVEMQGAAESEEGFRDSDGLAALLFLAKTLPLGLRRVAPLGSQALITTGIGLYAALGYDNIHASTLASLAAGSSAAYVTDNRRALIAALLAAVGIGIFFATTRTGFDDYEIVSVAGLWSGGWIAGSGFRIHRRHTATVERRAQVLGLGSEVRAREAVADQRARITSGAA